MDEIKVYRWRFFDADRNRVVTTRAHLPADLVLPSYPDAEPLAWSEQTRTVPGGEYTLRPACSSPAVAEGMSTMPELLAIQSGEKKNPA